MTCSSTTHTEGIVAFPVTQYYVIRKLLSLFQYEFEENLE